MKKIRMSLALVLSAAAVLVGGCTQDAPEINLVQNNVTQKSELRGEFYFRSTVIEAPYASFGFFVGNQNYHMERGIFDIQEKTLFFYRTYEFAVGGEVQGSAPDIETPLYETNDDGSIKMVDGQPVPVTFQRRVGNEMMTIQRFVYKGNPILAIPIEKHFDVQRRYNPATGEQTNVVEENTADREWWQRQYMRVAWGNQIGYHHDENIKPDQGSYGQVWALPELFDEQYDPEDAPVKVYEKDGTLGYFDYIIRNTVAAPTKDLPGYGTIPACYFYPYYLGQVAECNSERVSFRHAFMKVKPSDYVSWDYDDSLLKKFGYYRIERAVFDATRGVTYSGLSRRIRRFRMWNEYVVKKGTACTAPGGDVHVDCGEGEVCEALADGKFCVAADPNDRLDYSQMTPKPIVYYVSEQFPRDLMSSAIALAKGWAVAFDDVVDTRKGQGNLPAQGMYVLCENNLTEAAAAMALYGMDIDNPADVAKAQADGKLAQIDGACADMDKPKRNGDLRYSQIHSVNEPISYPLYGYGPSSADPMTGEILSANAYMYTPAMRRGANNAMLLIELLTGIRSFWETTYANHVRESGQRARLGAATGGLPSYTRESAQQVAHGMVAPEIQERLATLGIERTDTDWAQNRMHQLAVNRPDIAKMFVTDDVKMLHRDPRLGMETGETTEQIVDRLGMDKWGVQSGSRANKFVEQLRRRGEKNCQYLEEFTDGALINLAQEYGSKMDERVCAAAQKAEGTIFDFQEFEQLHGACDAVGAEDKDNLWVCAEVTVDAAGTTQRLWTNPCTIGKLKVQLANKLYDLNQLNPYWLAEDYFPKDPVYSDTKDEALQASQLVVRDTIDATREEIIQSLLERFWKGVAEHEVGHTLGLRHNFEGSTDAMNFGQAYWDLKGKFDGSGQFQAYDFLADETDHQKVNGMRTMQTSSVMDYTAKFNDRFAGIGYYDRAAIRFGYGGLVDVFNQDANMTPFEGYLADPAADDPTNIPTVHDIASNDLELLFKRVHYTNIPELFGSTEGIYDRKFVPFSQVANNKTADGRREVPYRFCPDELAYRTPTCATRDAGVDVYEITRNALSDYENYWPLWGYWHDSLTFFPDQYFNRVQGLFWGVKIHMQWWVAEFARFNNNDWWEKRFGTPWHEDPDGGLAGAVAVVDGINVMASAFGRPQPGRHGYRGSRDVFEPVPYQDNSLYTNVTYISATNCDARGLYPNWDYSGYLPQATQAGAIYDRLVAYEMLADPSTSFLAVDQGIDVEKYLISYYSLFPSQVMNLFSAMLANDTPDWGWYMVRDANGKPSRCHRRAIVGPDAGGPALADGESAWAFNPEPEYTFPTTRFRLPMLSAYYGLGLLLNHYDHGFVDITRVFLEGHQSAVTPTADADLLSFTDPLSGKTYTAVKDPNRPDLIYPAYRMIAELQKDFGTYPTLADLQANYNYSDYQFVLDKLELLRGMNNAYDYGIAD